MAGKKIFHIDLVYTAYRESETFDQEMLNQDRISALKKLLPQIETDQPAWSIFRQTGAQQRAEAKKYFHGFVIHYGDAIEPKNLTPFFSDLQVPFSTIGINNQQGGRQVYYSGTYIEMPVEAVTYQNGEMVQGYYELHYREFRNPAEMALSGIPMTYTEGGVDEVFNSAGMFEIRAWKEGQELVLVKPAEIHFQCTAILPNVSFFQLEENGAWTKEHGIQFASSSTIGGDASIVNTNGSVFNISLQDLGQKKVTVSEYRPLNTIDQAGYQGYTRIVEQMAVDKNQYYVSMNEAAWLSFTNKLGRGSALNTWVEEQNEKDKSVLVFRDSSSLFIELVTGRKMGELEKFEEKGMIYYKTALPTGRNGLENVVGDEPIPSTPGLVNGLKTSSFGVYNCDQTRRIEDPVAFAPTYFKKDSGEKLENLYVACVIDMQLNASLTYHPNHLVCTGSGKSKILIFDAAQHIFLVDEQTLAGVDLNAQQVNLHVKDITAEVKNPNDLRKILETR